MKKKNSTQTAFTKITIAVFVSAQLGLYRCVLRGLVQEMHKELSQRAPSHYVSGAYRCQA